MADFKYDLPAEEQLAIIEPRLLALERDHLNVSLDVQAAGPAGNPAQEERLVALEKTIEDLRARVKALSK